MVVDAEAVLAAWLSAQDVRPCGELPADLTGALPLVQVTCIGGPAERFSRSPRVALDVYAATYAAARSLALRLEDELQTFRGPVAPGAVVQSVRVDAGPSRRPYENAAIRRVGLTITLQLHPATHA